MSYKIDIEPRTFHFKQPAGTSRGIYTTRQSWFLTVTDTERPGVSGVGECAPLPDLSCDARPDYERTLRSLCGMVETMGRVPADMLRPYPSMLFGLETALLDLQNGGNGMLFDTPFTRGEEGITINGLVWMGSFDEMLERLEAKMRDGFRCVKLKIGAIDFNHELSLVRHIREAFTKDQIELRVDANGGFSPAQAPQRLEQLARYDIHSIEQPIRQHQWRDMAALCRETPIPIALDEELIGVNLPGMKEETARHHPPPIHHPQAIVTWRNEWSKGMDKHGSRARHRLMDDQCPRKQRRSERRGTACRRHLRSRHKDAARPRHRTAVHGQRGDAAEDKRRENLEVLAVKS